MPSSIRTKLSAVVAAALLLSAFLIMGLSSRQLSEMIDRNQRASYLARLDDIHGILERCNRRLQETQMVETYQKSFQERVIADIRYTYYRSSEAGTAPMIFDDRGRVVLHPKYDFGGGFTCECTIAQKALSTYEKPFRASDKTGKRRWCVSKHFEPWDWTIIYAIPEEIKYADITQFRKTLWGIMLAVVGIVVPAVSLAIARITRPIVKLTNASTEIAYGNLDADIPVDGKDEIGTLARHFVTMRDAIRVQIGKLNQEIEMRKQAEAEVAHHRDHLEELVHERTAELERIHKAWIDASRQAGMAEIATGVLHNVGNVLNSVNVSSSLVYDKIRHSKVADLKHAIDLACKHIDNMDHFVTQHPQGKHLLPYLSELSEHMAGEQKLLLSELKTLDQNVDHVKQIVATQQIFAAASGCIESTSVNELLNDAARLNQATFQRHQITVVKDLAQLPDVLTDKHKVLQILINLISNAKHALISSTRSDRQLLLKTSLKSSELVAVQVTDNGIGISKENLTRIFHHGFTTKKNGHGFGLHNAANAAKELNGSLTAFSAGPDTGATFTLTLSLAAAGP